jgi:TolB protein
LAGIVGNDLSQSGTFSKVQNMAEAAPATEINALPDFAAWEATGARYLLVGKLLALPDDRMEGQVRLWDIAARVQLFGRSFRTLRANGRRVGHMIADAIAQRATGQQGAFDTRIAYIAVPAPASALSPRLAIMDSDGDHPIFITTGKFRAANPRFQPATGLLAYTSNLDGQDHVYWFDPETGKQKKIGNFSGPTRMPAFPPKGRTVALICEANGRADICLVDASSEQVIRTLSHNAIDAFPSFSPDGKSLVFQSDRDGGQGIYVTDTDGASVRRLAEKSGRLGMPAWSPDGQHIAVTRYLDSGSRIAIMNADGSDLHDISTGAEDTQPAWTANSLALLFTRKDVSGSHLWLVNIAGRGEHQVPTSTAAADATASEPVQ